MPSMSRNDILLWIQSHKFSVKFFCGPIVGMSSFFGSGERTKTILLFIAIYICSVSIIFCNCPAYTFKSKGIIALDHSIALILLICTLSKIFSSIIQTISICMVRLLTRSAVQNKPMHPNFLFPLNRTASIKSFRALVPHSLPIPLRNTLKVFCVNNRVLIFSKWDKAIGLVLGLYNRVSFHAAFHRSSLKGLVK